MNNRKAFTLTELIVVIAVVAILALLPFAALAKTKAGSARIMCVSNLKQIGLAFRQWADRNADRYPMRVPYTTGGPNIGNNSSTFSATPNANFTYRLFGVLSNDLASPRVVFCPAESTLTKNPATVWTTTAPPGNLPYASNNNLSYFIGVDADQTNPRMFLTGDHNIGSGSVANTNPAAIVYANAMLSLNTNNPAAAWTEGNHQKNGNVCLTDGSVQQLNIEKLRETLRNTGDVWLNRVAFP